MATAAWEGHLRRPAPTGAPTETGGSHTPPWAGRARRLGPAAAIAALAWAVVVIIDVAGVDAVARLGSLGDLARTLVVVAGAVTVMRWRVVGDRGLLAAGLVMMAGGLAHPGEAIREAPIAGALAAGALLVTLGAARWRRPTTTSEPFALFLVFLGQGVWAETATPGTAPLFTALAALFAADGLSRGLRGAFRSQGTELAAVRAEEAAARAEREEREHDIRSALMAIDGAARTLERYHDRLDDENRSMLANALSSEVRRLQKLITETPRLEVEPFSLAAVLEPVMALARTEGVTVTSAVPAALHAVGRPEQTAQIVRTLLDNARLHAYGAPVDVGADRAGEFVVVRVEDRGPGVPPGELEAIFDRGRRGTNAEPGTGRGLGLSTAARLAAAQGGALWVEARPGGGASFVLRLRLAPG